MNSLELLDSLSELLSAHPRPEMFTNADHCSECDEHNRTLSSLRPDSLTFDVVQHQDWDPICFATPAAYLYFLPGLARLAAAGRGETFYLDRFASHLHNRVELLSPSERALVYAFLLQAYNELQDSPDLHEFAVHDIDGCLRQLEAAGLQADRPQPS